MRAVSPQGKAGKTYSRLHSTAYHVNVLVLVNVDAPENSGLFVSGTFTFTFTSTFTWCDSRFCLASQESLGGILDDNDAGVVRIREPSTDSGLRSDGMWHSQYED